MNDRLLALSLFVRVARTGSFSVGGRELKLSQPSASRLIAALEREVGIALFNRTTRIVTLTESGSTYLSRVGPLLSALEEAEHEARGTGELRGILRISLCSSLAIREVIPRLPRFTEQHPELDLQLIINDQQHDLLADGIDVGVRFGPLIDSTAHARFLGSWPLILAAAPTYLESTDSICMPSDLARHCIINGPMSLNTAWPLRKGTELAGVALKGRFMVSTNEAATAAAVAGCGIVPCALAACEPELRRGSLRRVLADWDMGTAEAHALYPGGRTAKAAARAFGNYLIEEFYQREASLIDVRTFPTLNPLAIAGNVHGG